MNLDNAEYALLTALVVFSNRESITNKHEVILELRRQRIMKIMFLFKGLELFGIMKSSLKVM